MPKFGGESMPNVGVGRSALLGLKKLLATTPGIFGYRIEEVKRAIRSAENYTEVSRLPQRIAKNLDDLYKQFR